MAKKKEKKKGGIVWVVLVVVLILLVGGIFLISKRGGGYPREEIDALAKCLTEKGTVMYGAFWCPKCAQQKKMFGSSFQYIEEIECDPRGENEQSELCIEKEVEKYPDWEFADGTRKVGILSFEELAGGAGCPVPQKN